MTKPPATQDLLTPIQPDFLEPSYEERLAARGCRPVTCLGQTFANDQTRREHYSGLLRAKLKDPAFRAQPGFPKGTDEDILALSDPPYYTACPNPFLGDFMDYWAAEKNGEEPAAPYHREPFAADVSEGKNDPIYNAHSYHTKVPHKAIMRYILHYTEPGDVVFDGFCGTGMTGVAAQMCGDRDVVLSLGYQVKADGTLLQKEAVEGGGSQWVPFSKLGARRAILNDLSPAATFIAYNYNTPVDVGDFQAEAQAILAEVEAECGWMYETRHKDGRLGRINYTVWSDVFTCPDCAGEVVFWDAAVDKDAGQVRDEFPCPHCGKELTKRTAERAWATKLDRALGETVRQAKQVPVLINYSIAGIKGRFEKAPDEADLALVEKIEGGHIPHWFPTDAIQKGDKTGEPLRIGITHTHHFLTQRNLHSFAAIFDRAKSHLTKCAVLGGYTVGLKTARFLPQRWINKDTGPMKPHTTGTLYIPSINGEQSWLNIFSSRCSSSIKAQYRGAPDSVALSSQSTTGLGLKSDSVDYLFLDPPFGANLTYSDLNLFGESWLKVRTDIVPEAIENVTQKKGLDEYRGLMTDCFREAYRVLKPGRWMTVEFSNTKASVWNNIQTAIAEAGFVVANVSALDKKQGSFNAYTSPTAVKQDLVISAYKPNGGFEERFALEAETEEGVWDFVATHLKYLPVTKSRGTALQTVPERDPRILFDQVVSYYVRKGYAVPISSPAFQQGLTARFAERDGMVFLSEQVTEYDGAKLAASEVVQSSLFVFDEATAIQWLRRILRAKPQTYQDIHPQFIQETQRGWSKNEAPLELSTLLEQNFLCHHEGDPDGVPSQLQAALDPAGSQGKNDPALHRKAADHWYLPDPNRAQDLEKKREKALLKAFEVYLASDQRRIKQPRHEVIRAGFKRAWGTKDYATIKTIAAKLPDAVIQEDEKLLLWYDMAMTRLGEE